MADFKAAKESLFSINDVSKGYDNGSARIQVLSGVDLVIDAGQTIAVVGASGIGKSTFLHILGALDRPDTGEILFRGEDIYRPGNRLDRFRNESIGFVFQFHHLLPEFSAVENVMIPCLIRKLHRNEAWGLARDMLAKVGLDHRFDHRVTDMSGGEQQRVALARALVLTPPVLLADEPTGNLDKKNSEKVHDLLMDLNHELRMTLIVVTHNMELAERMARRVTIIDGKLKETGF